MSGEEALRDNLLSRISFKIEAGKQFLVVVIGLGLTSSVAEKLRYAMDGPVKVNWNTDGAGATDGYFVSTPDPVFEIINLVTLGVFLFYALRFFFNNYLYLCQAYEDRKLKQCSVGQLRTLSGNASLDLILNLFTGVIICLVSMMLDPRRQLWLLLLLIIHFVVDFFVLGVTLLRRAEENGYRQLLYRVFGWLANNILFTIVFCVLAYRIFDKGCQSGSVEGCQLFLKSNFPFVIMLWFANCCLAYLFTAVFADRLAPRASGALAVQAD
jgi:hypothetical protein